MKWVFVVFSLVVASGSAEWPWPGSLGRTMDTPLSSEIETAISSRLDQENGNNTLDTPLCELDPDVVVDVLETCMSQMITDVNPDCRESLNLHALAAYTKHMIMESRFLGVQEIRRDLLMSSRLENLIRQSGIQNVGPGSIGKVPGLWKFARELQETVDRKVNSMVTQVGGTQKLRRLFTVLPLDVHIDVIADKTFRELLNQVIPHIKGVFQNFNEPDNCDVQNEQSGVLSVAEDLLDYLNGGFKDERELENIPQPFKEEVEIQLERNLGALARNLQTMISQYRSGNAKSAIQSYFVETVGSVVQDIHVAKMLEAGNLVERMGTVVRAIRRRGGDTRVARAFIRTLAMTLMDFDMPLDTVKGSILALVAAMEESRSGRPSYPY